jgi:L-lactate dehydrogenase complex protein LldE
VRVALFIPCFIDQLYPQVGQAVVTLLRRLGVDPAYPEDQTCCGQPAFNSGHWDEARALADRHVQIFAEAEAVVSPSGSCTAMVRHYFPELLGETAQAVAGRTFELTDFLVNKLGVTDVGARFPAHVTYHDACHALRELGLRDEPRRLLAAVRDLRLTEMDEADICCGFGGTFSVKFPMISAPMDALKIDSIQRTGADYVVSTDASCLMQIGGLLEKRRVPMKTMHLAEVLAQT